MTATLASLRVSLPADISDTRIAHLVSPEQLRIRGGIYSLARFTLADGRRIFMVSEAPQNEGAPMSRAAQEIATVVMGRYGQDIAPDQAVFVEDLGGYLTAAPAPSSRRGRVSHGLWVITWQERRAVFVVCDPMYNQAVH